MLIFCQDVHTYTSKMLETLTITQEDFNVVLDNFKKKNGTKREPVGFKTSHKK